MDQRSVGGDPPPRHGGDLTHATRLYGTPAGGWLDLSTGINPNPYPVGDLASAGLERLPSSAGLGKLTAAVRRAYRVPDGVAVAAAMGSDAAIRLLPLAAPPGPVAILSPTYRTHGEAWRSAGCEVTLVSAIDQIPPGTSVVVLANPNNPDGRRIAPDMIVALADRTGLVVVDEAFADVAPDASLVSHLNGLNAVVLRSFGKFYGLPGLRLGFVMGDGMTVSGMTRLIGDWPVSSAAIAIGTVALSDTAWQETTRTRLSADAGRLRRILDGHGLAVRGGTDLFVLIEAPDAGRLHEHLARRGIWTRAFDDQPKWLRVGLPGDVAGFARLDAALSDR